MKREKTEDADDPRRHMSRDFPVVLAATFVVAQAADALSALVVSRELNPIIGAVPPAVSIVLKFALICFVLWVVQAQPAGATRPGASGPRGRDRRGARRNDQQHRPDTVPRLTPGRARSRQRDWELERETRFEPATCSLEGCRSAN